jgi:hypothetical protein
MGKRHTIEALRIVIGVAVSIALAACGASPSSPMSPSNPAPLSGNSLQFAVGTANIAGTSGLNVVVTYRQGKGSTHPGDSGALLSSPMITVPAGTMPASAGTVAESFDALSTVLSGPATSEVDNGPISSSAQVINTTTVTSFGQSGGAFALGIEPFNATGSQDASAPSAVGAPFTWVPYPLPLYQATTNANTIVPWGGPPAFVATSSGGDAIGPANAGNYPAHVAGISEGIDVFEGVTPKSGGAYGLSVSVPANTGTVTSQSTFTLAAVVTIPTPANPTFVPDGNGGGSFSGWAMPAGATEALVEVLDYGPAQGSAPAGTTFVSCNGASEAAPVYYTLETSSSTLGNLPDLIGPNATSANAVPSICSAAQNAATNKMTTPGDQVLIQVIAVDYPLYESNPVNSSGNPSPTILGSSGSDDLTLSAPTCLASDGSACDSSVMLKHRQFATAYARHAIR